jgi:hypothetical protein
LRPLVASSWRRSEVEGAGRDCDALPEVHLNGDELSGLRQVHPLAAALPVCRDLLADAARETGSVFAVADDSGRLLWVEGDRADLRRAETIHFVPGADWAEGHAGTNAPGTALALGQPVQILAEEHFNEAVRPWSCTAAPIRDPDSGRILGAVDITGGADVGSAHALASVRATVRAMEAELGRLLDLEDRRARAAFEARRGPRSTPAAVISPGGRILHADAELLGGAGSFGGAGLPIATVPGETLVDGRRLVTERVGHAGYLVVRFVDARRTQPEQTVRLAGLGTDNVLLEVGGRRLRLSPRHSEIVVLLALFGEGMSAGRLAVELSLDTLSTVAVRADMSRLRAALGADLLDSQPYRFRLPVRCDLLAVRELLAEGRVYDALAVYTGPLLPGSQAPAVVEHRAALEQQVRGAVLGSRDPGLTWQWVGRPSGSDDLPAWEALAASFPAGSPQRAAALSRVRALRGGG